MQVQVRRKRKIASSAAKPVETKKPAGRALDQVRQGRVDYVPFETAEEIIAKQPGGPELLAARAEHEKRALVRREKFASALIGLQQHVGVVLFEEFEPDVPDYSDLFE